LLSPLHRFAAKTPGETESKTKRSDNLTADRLTSFQDTSITSLQYFTFARIRVCLSALSTRAAVLEVEDTEITHALTSKATTKEEALTKITKRQLLSCQKNFNIPHTTSTSQTRKSG
jgi:hypothetical protein